MITVSDEARKELEADFDGKEKTPIRVYLAPGGCGGPRLALALDEPGEEDMSFEDRGIIYCINKDLLAAVESVSIQLTPMGFLPIPKVPLPDAGEGQGCSSSGCGGCCGGCH